MKMDTKRTVGLLIAGSLVALAVLPPAHAAAVFTPVNGYTATKLHDSAGSYSLCGGLALDAGNLYFGHFTDIKSVSVAGGAATTVGTIAPNTGNALVVRHSGTTYIAFGAGGSSPYPAKMGYIDGTGTYQNELNLDGIYDAAVNSNGDCYIVADPGAAGSRIFQYDWATGSATEIANIGGYAGGLTFDSQDNLYYADQGTGVRDASILRFAAADVATAGLTAADATAVLNITAGYIEIDSSNDSFLYATTGWGSTLSKYSLATSAKLHDIASGGIGQIVSDAADLYVIDTDWGAIPSAASTIQRVVPEPVTVTLMALGAVALLRRRGA